MENLPLDEDLIQAMDGVFQIIKDNPYNKDTDEQLRRRIVFHNLQAMANVILIADSHPEVGVDFKRLALGILGTADWLSRDLPPIDDDLERNIQI